MFVKLAGESADESGRNKHRAQHKSGCNDWAGYFLHRLAGGVDRRKPEGDIALDVFDDDDGVINHDANRQHQSEQRKGIDTEAQRQHHSESADQRNRDSSQRNDRGAPGLEKEDHDEHNQGERLQECVHDCLDRMPHENRGVINDRVIEPLRKILLQLLHFGAHILGKLDGICARQLEDRNGHRSLVVEERTQRVAGGAKFEPGHVLEQRLFAVLAGLDDDLAELLLVD